MIFWTLLLFQSVVFASDRAPLAMACLANDQNGTRHEFEVQFHSAKRHFNLYDSEAAARIEAGPFPLLQIHIEKPAFGFTSARYEVRLGHRGDENGVVDLEEGFQGRFGETKMKVGGTTGRGFEVRVSRGPAFLQLSCVRSR